MTFSLFQTPLQVLGGDKQDWVEMHNKGCQKQAHWQRGATKNGAMQFTHCYFCEEACRFRVDLTMTYQGHYLLKEHYRIGKKQNCEDRFT